MSRFLFSYLFMLVFTSCLTPKAERVLADDLVADAKRYIGKVVEVEGTIVHICGVDGQKMKLKTCNGSVLMVAASAKVMRFSEKLNKARVRVVGVVQESMVDSGYVSRAERERSLLCHIDNTPCKDSAWTKRQVDAGRVDSLSQRDVGRVRGIMGTAGKPFAITVIIVAEQVEMIKKED